MHEIIAVGKTLSVFCILIIYLNIWGWFIDHLKGINIEIFISSIWISIHIFALITFFIWCWTR